MAVDFSDLNLLLTKIGEEMKNEQKEEHTFTWKRECNFCESLMVEIEGEWVCSCCGHREKAQQNYAPK